MTIAQRAKDGADTARIELDGRTFAAVSSNGASMALARQLVAAGYMDGPWQAVGRDGKRRLCGPSLHRLAKLTIRENDRVGLRLERFRPFDPAIRRAERRMPKSMHRRAVEAPPAQPAV